MPRTLHPADRATLFILAVVTATLAVAAALGAPVGGALAVHAALLGGFAGVAWWLGERQGAVARGIAVIAVMFTLYTTLGHVAFTAVPWLADPWLEHADRALLLGRSPSLALEPLAASPWTRLLSFGYAMFIPYLYLSIVLSLVGRPPGERDEFVTGFAVLYALSFLGYLFLPARGPIVQMAGDFTVPIDGGPFHAIIVRSVEQVGGPHGAFPSLHVGASLFATLFDLRHRNPLRALIYFPLVATISLATLVLRYHYAVDLVAAVVLAFVASEVARAAMRRRGEAAMIRAEAAAGATG
ncbi:MAG TPA: phosphatase PAP2 family protein [Longimicrobium sp.]|nr:phosphatase PAP2 family protein [Longimicrobium sp.]